MGGAEGEGISKCYESIIIPNIKLNHCYSFCPDTNKYRDFALAENFNLVQWFEFSQRTKTT